MSPLRPLSLDSRTCAYPLCPDEAELGKTYCRHHKDGEQVWPWDDHALHIAPAPRGPREKRHTPRRRQPDPRLNDEQLRDLHRRYTEELVSARTIAEDVWQAAGYASPDTCRVRIITGWRQLGLPVRRPGRIKR